MDKLFIELCEMYHEKVLKYLYYSIGNIEDAKDLTQEVFTHIYKEIESVNGHENVGGYIFKTAKYKAANFKRKRVTKSKREVTNYVDNKGETKDLHGQLKNKYDSMIDEEQYIDIVLSRLAKDKRQLYKYYYIEKKSHKEIAKILNINEASIRMKYVRLRREVKQVVHKIAEENFVANTY